MQQILDLHIHSRYSRACSPQLTLENIDAACRLKGVDIIATGDFTHPAWFKRISEDLRESFAGSGLYILKTASDQQVKFILSTEVSLIYKNGGKARRVHLVVHAPNLKAAAALNNELDKHFNIHSDGRPILGISAPDFVKLVLKIDKKFLIYPAHIWTPWFSVFGSKSGFNSFEECFQDQVQYIYAYETGLSSDPEMNWRLSSLDNLTRLSSSDAHSPNNIAREATVMDISTPVSYDKIYNNIKKKQGLKLTIEFYPEEGTYYADGHINCRFSCKPDDTRSYQGRCPRCQKPLTVGVLSRVEELADRPSGYRPKNAVPFKKIVELDKIIAEAYGIKSRSSVKVQKAYTAMVKAYGSELHILLDADLQGITGIDQRIIEGIERVRAGKLDIIPGYDGEYGIIRIFPEELANKSVTVLRKKVKKKIAAV